MNIDGGVGVATGNTVSSGTVSSGSASIDDTKQTETTSYSSTKIETELNKKVESTSTTSNNNSIVVMDGTTGKKSQNSICYNRYIGKCIKCEVCSISTRYWFNIQ